MNESLISGLLGAVMGGATSIEKSLAEEEAARRKEEEEKRREERAITLAERQEAMREARKAAQEKAKMERIASYLPAATGATPSQSPMEPEGGGITEYQVPTEQRLVRGFEAAMAKGDTDAAKVFSDQYKALKQEERAQAEEARKQEEFARGPKPKEPTGEVATIQFLARQTYTGPVGEDGKPDPVAFARHMKNVSESFIERKTYIRPERGAGGGAEGKPPTQSQIATADRALSAALPGIAKTKDISGKEVVDQQMLGYYRSVVNEIKKSDPNAVFDINGTLAAAQTKVEAAAEKAKQRAAREWSSMTDAEKRASGISSERAYVRKNYKSYISNYLGGAAEEERPDPLGLRIR